MEKPTLPKGTRDFGPAQMAKRQFIFDNIRKVFQKYGFQPLETPAMENLTTLTGKYGEEGDQLLFRILDSGEFFEKMKLDYASSQRFANIKDALYDFLKKMSQDIFQNTTERDFEKIQEVFDSSFNKIVLSSVRYLSAYDKQVVERFFLDEKVFLSNELLRFYFEAGLTNLNFEEKFEHHFRQFRDHILNKRLFPKALEFVTSKEIIPDISEKGLRYDLTVPFARYVVMNRHEITFPFKRYQIQPVWRADRPQKGRYREFYQCDADVVGTDSLLCEADIVLMIQEVFGALSILDYTIKINHRAILSGLAELTGSQNESSLFVAIDKLDKIGEEKVKEELRSRGFEDKGIDAVFSILNFKGTTEEKIEFLTTQFANSEKGKKGLTDLQQVLQLLQNYSSTGSTNANAHVEFDISLARGLSYYTGCIFEVKINNVAIGSVSGGGRYDNLTGVFGLPDVSGVGISFGVDRLYDAMEELKAFPEEARISSKVMIAHFDEATFHYSLGVARQLRSQGIATEVYPDQAKLKKQLDYANKKMIPFVLVIGSDEQKSGLLTLKDMQKGEQQQLAIEAIAAVLKNN